MFVVIFSNLQEFSLIRTKVTVWVASSSVSRNSFITTLQQQYRLSGFGELEVNVDKALRQRGSELWADVAKDNEALESEEIKLASKDVGDVPKLRSTIQEPSGELAELFQGYTLPLTDLDHFEERLQSEHFLLQEANVETLVSGEAKVIEIVTALDGACRKLTLLEDWLSSHGMRTRFRFTRSGSSLRDMRRDVVAIERKTKDFEVTSENATSLRTTVFNLMDSLSFSAHEATLTESLSDQTDLSTASEAAKALIKAREKPICPMLLKMSAVKMRLEVMETSQQVFMENISQFLEQKLQRGTHLIQTIRESSSPVHSDLVDSFQGAFSEAEVLIEAVKILDYEKFEHFISGYSQAIRSIYTILLPRILEQERLKISRRHRESSLLELGDFDPRCQIVPVEPLIGRVCTVAIEMVLREQHFLAKYLFHVEESSLAVAHVLTKAFSEFANALFAISEQLLKYDKFGSLTMMGEVEKEIENHSASPFLRKSLTDFQALLKGSLHHFFDQQLSAVRGLHPGAKEGVFPPFAKLPVFLLSHFSKTCSLSWWSKSLRILVCVELRGYLKQHPQDLFRGFSIGWRKFVPQTQNMEMHAACRTTTASSKQHRLFLRICCELISRLLGKGSVPRRIVMCNGLPLHSSVPSLSSWTA